MNKDELIEKICKRVILVFGVLSIFNFILLINKKSYALFTKTIVSDKVVVHIETGDELPFSPGPAIDIVKNKIVKNVTDTCTDFETEGGLVAINTEGTLYQENSGQEIREYRYVGPKVNNYVYFSCAEDTTNETASANCETWRIIGIFKDEEGEEHIKIVRNYRYEIHISGVNDYDINNKNDFANSNIKETLNTRIYNMLSSTAQSMIKETTYYLGNVTNGDKTIKAYTNERGSTPCSGTCGGGKVLEGNQATWTGNIALMYPSDIGYSSNSCNWNTAANLSGTLDSSWFLTAYHRGTEWLLSPSSYYTNRVAIWRADNSISNDTVEGICDIRPTLYLTSDVKITGGNGTSETPYFLEK